ncbi:MAG: sigma-54-dependent transcriptional regulator [Desulfohalobiaceae bacterium]
MAKVLIVDDDPSLREVLEVALDTHGHQALSAECIAQALQYLQQEVLDLALLDLRLGQESGIDLLQQIKEQWPGIPVLMITAYADSQSAVQAMKLGARDYISKPFDMQELLLQVDRILESCKLEEENQWLKQQLQDRFGPIIGQSLKIKEVFQLVQKIAPTGINCLITGESGTGKELIARAIHEHSPRQKQSFLVINCGGVPENLVESELFGYRKGAFTGAEKPKKGLLQKADQGSFLLDEVGELHTSTQVKLLRCIQDGSFIPLGGTETIKVNVRFIAATNRAIEQEVAEGRFREDLFYRLSGVIIKVPPLRERDDDLLLLAEHFLQRFCKEQNKDISGFSSQAEQKLKNYHYPGNIRELENIMERAVALESGSKITPSSLVIYDQAHPQTDPGPERVFQRKLTLDQYLEEQDQKILQNALERTNGHKGKAAELLGLSFRQFRYRLSKYNLGHQFEGKDD